VTQSASVFPNYFRENNVNNNSSNNNNDSRLTHLRDEAFGSAPACCCCCCDAAAAASALAVTSQLAEERARQTVDVAGQSGTESGQERSHCCSAQKLNPTIWQERQIGCDVSIRPKICDDSSFEFCDAKLTSQPGHESVRGRRQRRCSQGNCDGRRQQQDECFVGESDEAEMRLVKKCSLDGPCGPDRPSQTFDSAPRWSCGVPGLGASIQQVRTTREAPRHSA